MLFQKRNFKILALFYDKKGKLCNAVVPKQVLNTRKNFQWRIALTYGFFQATEFPQKGALFEQAPYIPMQVP